MIEKLASFGAAVGISVGAAAFQTVIVPKEHPLEPVALITDNEPAVEPSRQRQLRILTDGLRFEDLAADPSFLPASAEIAANSAPVSSQAGETESIDQASNNPIEQLIDGLALLDEYQNIDLRDKFASLPRVSDRASGRSSSVSYRSITTLQKKSERYEQRESRSLLRSRSASSTRKSSNSGGGVGGFGGARSSQSQLGASNFPAGAGSSGSSNLAASIDNLLQSPAALDRNTLLASNSTTTAGFSAGDAITTTSTSGRPQLTADGKYGIPNHQYWTFDFTDQNEDNVVDRLDADLHFADYLVGLEADLEAAKQVVKFSPVELQSIYTDLNSQVPPEKSPSYLTFMIIDFPIKGFYLPYDEIPANPGLPAGAVD